MLEFWGMWSNPSLPSLPGSLWPGVVATNRVLSVGQIEINCNYAKLFCLKLTVLHLTVCKQKTVLKLN